MDVVTSNDGRKPRVRAPELIGHGWVNTGGTTLSVADLRGAWTLLDFWTSGCINCLHVLEELRPLEERYGDALQVVGVHSPKFAHEATPASLESAVARLGVDHPVLDDADMRTWQAYTARAWPTLVLVDPEGYVVAQYAGEGHAHAIGSLIDELTPTYAERGSLHPGGSAYVAGASVGGDLRFPAVAIALGDGALLVADAGSGTLVELEPDATTVRRRIEGFREPNGLVLLPDAVRRATTYDVVVADTTAHQLKGVRLSDGDVTVLAGDGEPWRSGDGLDRLSSPWDVTWWRDRVWVAMAGIHQLWTFDPLSGAVAVAAGTTNEGIVDGPANAAWFSQPSRLVADGDVLWVADPEASALRRVTPAGDGRYEVATVLGSGLFDFGFADGTADVAAMQHPLGLAVLPDGTVAIADTYNGAVRRFDPRSGVLSTMATGLAEPSGLLVADGILLVVESAAHRLVPLDLDAHADAPQTSTRTARPVTEVRGGEVDLVVAFRPPPGQKLDDRYGPSTRLVVTSTPPALVAEGSGRGSDLVRRLVIDPAVGDGVLHVAAQAASCDVDDGEGAACHVHQQDWGIPVRVSADGAATLELPLGGTAD